MTQMIVRPRVASLYRRFLNWLERIELEGQTLLVGIPIMAISLISLFFAIAPK